MKRVNFTKVLIRMVQRRIATPGNQPVPAKVERLSKQQVEFTQPGHFHPDQKLLRLYKAIDLAG